MQIFLAYLLLCVIWSSTWIFIKLGLDAGLPPFSFAAARFGLSVLILLVILRIGKIALPRTQAQWRFAAVTGLMQFFVNYGLLFWGEQHISSGLAAVLQATIPAFGLILARIYLPDEPITVRKVIAITVGIAGVVAIFYEQLTISGWLALAGCAAVVMGAFFAAFASVLTKLHGEKFDATALLTAQMLCGVVPLVFVGAAREGSPTRFQWTLIAICAVLYLALIGSIAAFWLYYWLLRRIEASKAMMISLITPFAAVVIGSVALGESLPRQTLVGGALILFSVGLILFRRRVSIES
jgi:drug/metabolite transporter (DMT)-like permease